MKQTRIDQAGPHNCEMRARFSLIRVQLIRVQLIRVFLGDFSQLSGVKFGIENTACVKEMTNIRYVSILIQSRHIFATTDISIFSAQPFIDFSLRLPACTQFNVYHKQLTLHPLDMGISST